MSNTTTSPNMNLPVPNVATDPGPDWAQNLNSCLSIIDQHNHSGGSGVPITPAGLDINSDLPMSGNNLTLVRSVRFSPQSVPLSLASDLGCLYESGVDLYYNDGNGNQIRITQGGSVAGSSGTITGLPSGTASAAFSGGTFIFQRATNTGANIDGASYVFRLNSASSPGLTLSPPASLSGGSYALSLPAIPGSTQFLTIDTSGNMATASSVSAAQIASRSIAATQVAITPPTIQKFLSGSGTYTAAANVSYIRVVAVGGGAGGGASATSGTGSNGSDTTFGSALIVAGGGTGGGPGSGHNGGVGGSASLGAAVGIALVGGSGAAGTGGNTAAAASGGSGGSSAFGGGGSGGNGNTPSAGQPGVANTGGGGGGGGAVPAIVVSGCGGGAGGYVDALVYSPSATYAYSVGAGGAGAPNTGGGSTSGGDGGSGMIIVYEYYL